MPASLEPGDRKLLIVAGALVLILTGASLIIARPPSESPFGVPTTYSATSSGLRAAYLLLKGLGYSETRWERPLTELTEDAEGMVLILPELILTPSGAERRALSRFLAAGGQVLATGPSAAEMLPDGGIRDQWHLKLGWKQYRALLVSPLTRGAPQITMASAPTWAMEDPGQLGVYGADGDYVVATYGVGRGRVIWWAAPTPLTNAGIREPGNLALLLNALGPPAGTRVVWDEFHHGYRGSLWSYLERTPVPWAFLQVGLAFLALLVTFSRRSSPVRAPAVPSRLAPLEFVETLGDLYHRAQAAPAAVEIAYRRFRFLLTRALGLPPASNADRLERAARERLGWSEPDLGETLKRCEHIDRETQLTSAQALRLVRALHHYAELLNRQPLRARKE
jgi:hypothetical protein